MLKVYAECPVHRFFEFDPRNALQPGALDDFLKGARTFAVNMEDSKVPCPTCGLPSRIPDGVYKTTAFGTTFDPASTESHERVDRLKTALRTAQVQRTSNVPLDQVAENLEAEVRAASPLIGKVLDGMSSQRALGVAQWVSVLIALIALFVAMSGSISEDDVRRVISDEIEKSQHQETASPTQTGELPAPAPQDPGPGAGTGR